MSTKFGLGSFFFVVSLLFVGKGVHSVMSKYHATTIQEADIVALFSHDADSIAARTQEVIADAQKQIESIIAISHKKRTWANTMAAYDHVMGNSDLMVFARVIGGLQETTTEETIRNAAQEASVVIEQFVVDVDMNQDLYEAITAYKNGNASNENLTETQWYFIEQILERFERNGLDKSQEVQAQIKSLQKRITELCIEYSKNYSADGRSITVNPEDLRGLDEAFISNLKQDGDMVVLGIDSPTYTKVIAKCSNRDIRKQLWTAYRNRAYPANEKVLSDLIDTRDELAQLLGYNSYAAYELSGEMVKSLDRAQTFLSDVLARASQKEQVEYDMLIKDLPEGITLTTDGLFYPWDFAYVKEQYRKKHYDIDHDLIAQYFPMEKTIQGLLAIYEQFLSVRFEQTTIRGLWHEDVRTVKVYDSASGDLLGYLLLDLHPRPFKYPHACEYSIVTATRYEGKPNIALSCVLANFPKAQTDKPSLLKLSDVRTFFHEFGHALHDLLGRQDIVMFAGATGVKHDFVEMPSQILEEWIWDKEILQMISGHYQTGEQLPSELIDTLIAVKNLTVGGWLQYQLMAAHVSLGCHMAGTCKDIKKVCKHAAQTCCTHIAFDDQDNFYTAFTHLTGYAARYYGYMWSKVYAQDLFEEIKKHGLLNAEIGKKYRELILERGGSKDQNEMLKDFLGREPNSDAFFKDLGI